MQGHVDTSSAQNRKDSDRLRINHHRDFDGHPFDVPLHQADQYRELGGPFRLFVLGVLGRLLRLTRARREYQVPSFTYF
jgi:hypothetical protein